MAEEIRESSNFIHDFIDKDLEDGVYSSIQTRFPPEPNGYLHIGHAKAICINFGVKEKYKGVCNLRLDDTNPTKEDTEYVDAIKEDIQWLGFQWDNLYYASDYFDFLFDCAIKLIAWYHENPEGAADAFSAGVEPMLVPESNQLAGVNDVFNAVLMQGDMLGDVVFYGKGAGKLPTASAVVADVIDALKDGSKIHDSLFWKPAEKLDHQLMDTAKYSYYIRTAGVPAAALPNVAGPGKLVFDYGDSAAYLIEAATTADLEAVAAKLEVLGGRLALVLKKLPE